MSHSQKKLSNLRNQLNILKERLDHIEKILDSQEQLIEVISENTKVLFKGMGSLIKEKNSKDSNSVEEIMWNALPSKRLPNILFK